MLMRLYKNDDPQDFTFEHILKHNKLKKSINTHLYSKVKILKEFGMEWEDIESEINMALFKAYKTYDNSSSVFVTYALHITDNEIKKLLNHITRGKRNIGIEKSFDSLNRKFDANDENSMLLEETVSNNEISIEHKYIINQCQRAINKYFISGTEYEQDLIRCMFERITQQDLSDKYGYSRMYHSNKMNTLRKQILKDENVLALKPCSTYNNIKSVAKPKVNNSTRIINVLKDDNILATFKSFKEIQDKSKEILGVKLHQSGISERLARGYTQYKGFTIEVKLGG